MLERGGEPIGVVDRDRRAARLPADVPRRGDARRRDADATCAATRSPAPPRRWSRSSGSRARRRAGRPSAPSASLRVAAGRDQRRPRRGRARRRRARQRPRRARAGRRRVARRGARDRRAPRRSRLEVTPIVEDVPVACDQRVVDAAAAAAEALGLPYRRMTSGAYHDAMIMGARVPIGMIFVPSARRRQPPPGRVHRAGGPRARRRRCSPGRWRGSRHERRAHLLAVARGDAEPDLVVDRRPGVLRLHARVARGRRRDRRRPDRRHRALRGRRADRRRRPAPSSRA